MTQKQEPDQDVTIITSPDGVRIFPMAGALDHEVRIAIAELREKYGEENVKMRHYVGNFTL